MVVLRDDHLLNLIIWKNQKDQEIIIDTVYQRVLALANKEQRGYITPQEFNLFANQAQLEIFEQYFYDINQFSRLPGNETEFSDIVNLINEKVSIFKKSQGITVTSGTSSILSPSIYRLGVVRDNLGKEVEQVDAKELAYLKNSSLTNPGFFGSYVYTRANNKITVHPPISTTLSATIVRKPDPVAWGYIVVDEKAMYDPLASKTFNFELHPSEETELVYRILSLAGVTLNKPELTQAGMGMVGQQQSTEKA